jgi:hypothetical protein
VHLVVQALLAGELAVCAWLVAAFGFAAREAHHREASWEKFSEIYVVWCLILAMTPCVLLWFAWVDWRDRRDGRR